MAIRSQTQTQTYRPASTGALIFQLALVAASLWPLATPAATGGQDATAAAPARPVPHRRNGDNLDARARFLTKALGLDAQQQSELRKVLIAQRDEINKAWADESLPEAERIRATELVSERTADRIRALLNDEQKKKYNPPRAATSTANAADRPDVEQWMNPAAPK